MFISSPRIKQRVVERSTKNHTWHPIPAWKSTVLKSNLQSLRTSLECTRNAPEMHKTAQKTLNLATLCDACWQHSGCNSAALGAAPSSEIWKCKAPRAPLVPRAPPSLPEMIHRESLRYPEMFRDRNLVSNFPNLGALHWPHAAQKHLQYK